MQATRFRTVIFDADSTLASIEGIDWLATLRSPEVTRDIAELTNRAMNGELPLDDVYGARIARLRPTVLELAALGQAYIAHAIDGARALIAELQGLQVETYIVSGGIRSALLPLAEYLGIAPQHVHAVSLAASSDDGALDLLDGEQPLATQSGKVRAVQTIRTAGAAAPIAFVGDGSTDAAVRDHVDSFFAYTEVARRPAVVAVAEAEAPSMRALRSLLLQ